MSSDEDTQCWFCWEEVTTQDRAPSLGCSCKGALTTAHKACIKDWLDKHPEECPNCRSLYDKRVVAALVSARPSLKASRSSATGRPMLRAVRHGAAAAAAGAGTAVAAADEIENTTLRRRQAMREALEARRRAHDDNRRNSLGRSQGPQLRRSSRTDPDAPPSHETLAEALAEAREEAAMITAMLRANRRERAASSTPPDHCDPAFQAWLEGMRPARDGPLAGMPPRPSLPSSMLMGAGGPSSRDPLDLLRESAAMAAAAAAAADSARATLSTLNRARQAPTFDPLEDLFAPPAPRPSDALPNIPGPSAASSRGRAAHHRAELLPPLEDLLDPFFAEPPAPPANTPAADPPSGARHRSHRTPHASPAGPRLRLRAVRAAVRRAVGRADGSEDDEDDAPSPGWAAAVAAAAARLRSGSSGGGAAAAADGSGSSSRAAAAAAGAAAASGGSRARGGRGAAGAGGAEAEDEEVAVMVASLSRQQRGGPALRPLAPRPAIRKLRVPRSEWEVIDLTTDD